MPLYRPQELMEFLRSLGISPKKSLSQNFLIDGNIIRKIIKAANLQSGETVLEVGPGPGVLTEQLLESGAHVIAVEKDEVLAKALHRFNCPSLKVFCDDILEFPLENHISSRMKVIANLPYHITTPVLAKFATQKHLISECIVMVQDEVARRLSAKPGTSEYGSITAFLNFYGDVNYLFKVSRNCFFPAPKVDSAMIKLILNKDRTVSDPSAYFRMVRTAFEHRRKMLRSSLSDLYPASKIIQALLDIDKKETARPEEFSVDDFIALFNRLN